MRFGVKVVRTHEHAYCKPDYRYDSVMLSDCSVMLSPGPLTLLVRPSGHIRIITGTYPEARQISEAHFLLQYSVQYAMQMSVWE